MAAFAVTAAWWHTQDMHAKLPPIPRKHLGKWIALDHGNTKIVAVGDSLREARRAARAKGEPRPWMLKVPSGLFVGAGR